MNRRSFMSLGAAAMIAPLVPVAAYGGFPPHLIRQLKADLAEATRIQRIRKSAKEWLQDSAEMHGATIERFENYDVSVEDKTGIGMEAIGTQQGKPWKQAVLLLGADKRR